MVIDMTVDETIAKEKANAEKLRKIIETGYDGEISIEALFCDDTDAIKEVYERFENCAKEYEQLAEWLEELKEIKSNGRYVQGNKAGQKIGYRNAIDDFADRLKEMANSSSTKYIRLSEEETMTTYGVEQIAKQLKAGGKYE